MNIMEIGFEGEKIVRDYFVKENIKFMQVDLMFYRNNEWCLAEVKAQEKFKAPPFDGHGLPEWQIKRRLKFESDTGIKAYLIVYDLEDKCLYIALMSELMKGEYIITNGAKPRIIFNINLFKRVNL